MDNAFIAKTMPPASNHTRLRDAGLPDGDGNDRGSGTGSDDGSDAQLSTMLEKLMGDEAETNTALARLSAKGHIGGGSDRVNGLVIDALNDLASRQERAVEKLASQLHESLGKLQDELATCMCGGSRPGRRAVSLERGVVSRSISGGIKTEAELGGLAAPLIDLGQSSILSDSTDPSADMTPHEKEARDLSRKSQASKRSSLQECMDTVKVKQEIEPTSRLQELVHSNYFDQASALLLSSNALFIGVQVQFSYEEHTPYAVDIIDYAYCFFFIVELALRFLAFGCRGFFCGPDQSWNIFDFMIVALSTFDTGLSIIFRGRTSPLGNVSLLRIIRMVRITRVLRVIRVMKFFKDLRVMIAAIASTLKTACWALILLLMAMYIFGIAIAQLTAEYLAGLKDEGRPLNDDAPLIVYFGSLWKAIFTLFMSIAGGIDWADAYMPVTEVGVFPATVYIFFIMFASFCVMNVIIGIFCQNATEAFERDKDNFVEHAMNERKMHVETLKELFAKWETDGDGEISKEEFAVHLEDPKMHGLLKMLDIERRDALALFSLLDADGSGGLDVDEFICGCITFKGAAKAIHIEQTALEMHRLLQKMEQLEMNTAAVHRWFTQNANSFEAAARMSGAGSKSSGPLHDEVTVPLPHALSEFEEC
jgi:voltage-gated sodium channel